MAKGLRIVWISCLEIVDAVIKRIETVIDFPSIGKAVAIAVFVEWVGLAPYFVGIVEAVVVGIALDEPVKVCVFAEAIGRTVTIGVGVVGVSFCPSLCRLYNTVWPITSSPWFELSWKLLAVAIDPSVSVGVFDTI